MDVLYARARVDDLDIDARPQWVGKGKNKSALHALLSANKQALNLLQLTVGHVFPWP